MLKSVSLKVGMVVGEDEGVTQCAIEDLALKVAL